MKIFQQFWVLLNGDTSLTKTEEELSTVAARPIVQVLCNLRLGVTAVAAIMQAVGTIYGSAIIFLLAIPVNWIPLRFWGKSALSLTRGWRFPLADVTVSLVLASQMLQSGSTSVFGVVYLCASALMMGMMLRAVWAWVWGLIVATGVMLRVSALETEYSLTHYWWLTLALGVLLLSGLRLRRQLEEIDHLSRALSETKGKEHAAAERLTIARDLHDTLAKSLAGIRMLSETLSADLAAEGSDHTRLAQTIFDSADQASREARMVLDELRVPQNRQDVLGALRAQAQIWGERTSSACEVNPISNSVEVSGDTQWHLQRILGELLTNVEKHAQASRVRVSLNAVDDMLTIAVEDDGTGISQRHRVGGPVGHYGLLGIHQRAEALGGDFEITNSPELGGVMATVQIPLSKLQNSIPERA